jgi:phage/conjugal plasmid C-4 type zinc finger TraR family protein
MSPPDLDIEPIEHLTDPIDIGSRTAEQANDEAVRDELARARAGMAPAKTWRRASARRCVDCDARIPDDRRQAVPGVKRCIECQEIYERRAP